MSQTLEGPINWLTMRSPFSLFPQRSLCSITLFTTLVLGELSWLSFSFGLGLLDLGKQVNVNEQVLFFPGCWKPKEKKWGHLTAALETKAIPSILLTVPPLITGVDGNGGREWDIPNGRGIQNVAWEEICVCVFEI